MKKFIAGVLFGFLTFSAQGVLAFDYTLAIEGGEYEDPAVVAGDIVDLAFDTIDMDIEIYGNIQIEFDPTVLEALYVDESYDFWGLWTGWTPVPGDSAICGGGEPYSYAAGLGSDRGDLYAAYFGDFNAGPSAYIDNINGTIRFYHINTLSPGLYEPLRLGFKVLATGPVDITIKSQAEPVFDWCDFDTEVTTQFVFGAPPTAVEIIEDMIWLVTYELYLSEKVEKKYLKEIAELLQEINKSQDRNEKTGKVLKKIEHFVKKVVKDIHRGRINNEDGSQVIDIAYDLYDTVTP